MKSILYHPEIFDFVPQKISKQNLIQELNVCDSKSKFSVCIAFNVLHEQNPILHF